MKNVFLFFRHKVDVDSQLERDFRGAYQEPSLHYLELAFILGIIGFAGFLAMDLVHGTVPALPGMTAARIAICFLYVLGLPSSRSSASLSLAITRRSSTS
ncbi:MAG TPA: hypothetical protein VGO85_03450 [Caldimonas sp.]|nr:hypothetical protein [Caldimonas sp.]